MSTIKTLSNDGSVEDFINSLSDEAKRADSFKLLEIFSMVTGYSSDFHPESKV